MNDENNDLMSCIPKWVPVDSSDEEAENLRNDPALNLKFDSVSMHSLPSPKKSIEFSDAVIKYKNRRSLELNSSLNQTSSNELVSNQVYSLSIIIKFFLLSKISFVAVNFHFVLFCTIMMLFI